MKSAVWFTDKPLMPTSGIAEERSQIGVLACTEIASSGILAYFIAYINDSFPLVITKRV